MVGRPDAVLAVIPVLAVSGIAISRFLVFLESVVGVGGGLVGLPFTFLGLCAAVGVIGWELADPLLLDE